MSYARVVEPERLRGSVAGALLDPGDGQPLFSVRARAVVNATGPWVDAVRALEDPGCAPLVRLSKGAHVVLRGPEDGSGAGVVSSRDGSRTTFAVPFYGMLLLGVTDTPHDEPPRRVAPAREDVEALFEDASHFVSAELLERDRVTHAFAGLRALPRGEGETSGLSREHVVSTGPGGMISVAGGKLTTHRLIAVDTLRRLPPELGLGSIRPTDEPLPGGEPPPLAGLLTELDADITGHLVGLYGADAAAVVAYGESDPALLERIDPQGPDVWAQVRFAVEHEWARTADDVLRRRTTLALRGLEGPVVRARVASLLDARVPEPVA